MGSQASSQQHLMNTQEATSQASAQRGIQPFPKTRMHEASPNENVNPNQLRRGSLHSSGALAPAQGAGQAAMNDSFISQPGPGMSPSPVQ